MKSLFTLIFVTLVSLLSAQTLSLSPSEYILNGTGDYIDYGTIDLTNNGNTTVEIAVSLERVCYTEGDDTDITICIDQACFIATNQNMTWGATGTSLLTLAPGETSDVLKFSPDNEIYGSEWNVIFYERNNVTNSTTLNVKIAECNALITSTNDFAYTISKAFPNPATDVININYQIDVNDAQLNMYNAMGVLLKSITINPQTETVSVDVADLASGVYFYNITDGKDQSKMMSFVK